MLSGLGKGTEHIIELNHSEEYTSGLPYVIFPNLRNVKFFVDTGATKSFIDPEIAKQFFSNTIKYDPFIVSNSFSSSKHLYTCSAEIPEILKHPRKYMKFHIFKFHKIFKGLIGYDILKLLNVTLDLKYNLFITPNANLKLSVQGIPHTQHNSYVIEPRTEKIIKIRTNIENGEIIIPHTISDGCAIPECITISNNSNHISLLVMKPNVRLSSIRLY